MPTEVKLPQLAEGVVKGEIVSVSVKVGDNIDVDTMLIEVESEKATLPVPSPVKGKVTKVLVKEGDKVAVGEPFLEVEEEGEASGKSSAQPAAESGSEEKKAAPAPAGKKSKAAPAGNRDEDDDDVAENIRTIASEETNPDLNDEPSPDSNGRKYVPATHAREPGEPIPAGPAVRRIARELGIDLAIVPGSGPNGRIYVEDLDPYVRGYISKRGGGSVAGPGAAPIELPDFSKFGKVSRQKPDSLRRKIAERMTQSWTSVPHVHQFADADITELMALQKRYKERVKEAGGSLTLTVFALKAVALALKEFPQFNVSYDVAAQEIVSKDYIHIGVAVDTPNGLIVPVLRDVDKKPLLQLSKELNELAQRTRDRKTSIEDLRGGTFTISNLGGIGGTYFTPIVNAPEVAILGIGRSQRKPVYNAKGELEPRDICPICVGYDHRVIDGADGARFTVRLVEILENFEAAFLGF
jgi:pyruvate dehydrogenase E2 component (dihydrolipoamide acetyltransferase)